MRAGERPRAMEMPEAGVVREGEVFLFPNRVQRNSSEQRRSRLDPACPPGSQRKWLVAHSNPPSLWVFSQRRDNPEAIKEGVLRLYHGYGIGVGQFANADSEHSQRVIIVSGANKERQFSCKFSPNGDEESVEAWRGAIVQVLAEAPPVEQLTDLPPSSPPPTKFEQASTAFHGTRRIMRNAVSRVLALMNLPLWLRATLRLLWLLFCFVPLFLGIPIIMALVKFTEWITELWWNYALLATECNGATFIKLAQWAASRRDLFPEEFCDRFSKMHSAAPSHSWKDTQYALDKSFGEQWRDTLSIERTPLGTGCVAQVHKGTLVRMNRDGSTYHQDVAVKVVHPGLRRSVQIDVALLSFLARTVERINPKTEWLGLTDTAQEFSDLMFSQLDMRQEAGNLRRLIHNFAASPTITFPQPIDDYVSELVLTETFEGGIPIADFVRRGNPGMKRRLARSGLAAFMQMIFIHNFAHADLHPGNILVSGSWEEEDEREGPTEAAAEPRSFPLTSAMADSMVSVAQSVTGTVSKLLTRRKGALVFLDGGLALQLRNADRKNFVDIMTAICQGDGQLVANLMLDRCKSKACDDPEAFKAGVVALVKSSPATMRDFKIGDMVGALLDLCQQHRVKHFSSFTSVLMATAVMEGVGRSLDPDLDVLATSLPFVTQGHYLVGREEKEHSFEAEFTIERSDLRRSRYDGEPEEGSSSQKCTVS